MNLQAAFDRRLPRPRLELEACELGKACSEISSWDTLAMLMARNAEIWGHLLEAATVRLSFGLRIP